MLLNLLMVESSFVFLVWHKAHTKSGLNFKILIWTRETPFTKKEVLIGLVSDRTSIAVEALFHRDGITDEPFITIHLVDDYTKNGLVILNFH